ncbi:MAG: hypothetical protein ACF8R7_06705 [Phycisphaerales bacterium JB039]
MNRSARRWGALAACAAVSLAACAPRAPAPVPVAASTSAEPVIREIEPWSFRGADGVIISTAHYRLFTTAAGAPVMTRLPAFLEDALEQYRSLGGDPATGERLPAPAIRLDTFMVSSRTEWEDLTVRLMGDRAGDYLRIERGGFAAGGRGVFYTAGAGDDRTTLAIAAHEGWHQYAQRTMRDPLPVWLDEALAVYSEGYRENLSRPGGAEFLPWANPERFDQLRSAWARGDLLELEKLLEASPQRLLAVSTEGTLDYYAQLWALAHFVREDAPMRAGLHMLLADAAGGRVRDNLRRQYGARGAERILALRQGPLLFQMYIAADMTVAASRYRAFVERIVQAGAKERIVLGLPPV